MKSKLSSKETIIFKKYVDEYIEGHCVTIHNKTAFNKACFEAFCKCRDNLSYNEFEKYMMTFPHNTNLDKTT